MRRLRRRAVRGAAARTVRGRIRRGAFAGDTGSTECSACAPGSFADAAGSAQRAACDAGSDSCRRAAGQRPPRRARPRRTAGRFRGCIRRRCARAMHRRAVRRGEQSWRAAKGASAVLRVSGIFARRDAASRGLSLCYYRYRPELLRPSRHRKRRHPAGAAASRNTAN